MNLYSIYLFGLLTRTIYALTAPSTYPSYLGCFYDPREPYNKFGDTKVDGRDDFSIDECRFECGCN